MPEPSIPFVILMGVGVVFIGLICIILLSMAMSAICRSMGDKTPAPAPAAAGPRRSRREHPQPPGHGRGDRRRCGGRNGDRSSRYPYPVH